MSTEARFGDPQMQKEREAQRAREGQGIQVVTPGNALGATEKEEPTFVDLPEPTDPIVVIRHHLYEALLAISDASTFVGAHDLTEAIRAGRRESKASPFAGRLARIQVTLESYLGLLEDEDAG